MRSLKPKCTASRLVRVGCDDLGIGAVAFAEQDEGPERVHMCLVARARRLCASSVRAGDEAIREIFQWAIGRADDAGLPYVDVTAKVEPRNVSSRKMLDRVGMKIYSVGFDPPYDLWGTRVDLEQDEAEPADAEPADAEPADAVPDGTGPGGDVGGDEPEPGSSSTR